jgi:hypothetical protein
MDADATQIWQGSDRDERQSNICPQMDAYGMQVSGPDESSKHGKLATDSHR